MWKRLTVLTLLIGGVILMKSCDPTEPTWGPAHAIDAPQPPFFPEMIIPADNPQTEEGIELGRMLFNDKILSGDNTQACADCHFTENSFSDPRQFSVGIDGIAGDRQAMVIVNLGWQTKFFWDGRAGSLEEQALAPVTNPIEMHETWSNAIAKLKDIGLYRRLFVQAFNEEDFDSTHASKAMAQFMRTLVSYNSKYDKVTRGEAILTAEELDGRDIFNTERGDCFHCHGSIMFTDDDSHNNGLDATHQDSGVWLVTADPQDIGLFRTPTLRNIELSAPYMHDGRFNTLDEVIEFYSSGLEASPTVDPLMKHVAVGGIQFTNVEKENLKAFLLTLTDFDFIENPQYE
jgi:cytochrome c peroxidase